MARILVGWEFGANRGHARRISELAAVLRGQGHEIAFAVQRIDALTPEQTAGSPVWQAPISPRLLVTTSRGRAGPPAGLADILSRLGLDDSGLVASVLRGWRLLFDAVKPDLVVADFAPFLLMAARARHPSVAVGNGFTLPPAEMSAFPRLIDAPGTDQAKLLDRVNAALATVGAAPLTALPQVFGADRSFADGFAEIDPYAEHRRGPLASPLSPNFSAEAGEGEEVFVYAPEMIPADSPLWQGLAESGLPVRVHVPRAPDETREAVAVLGLLFEPEPLPIPLIAERSRLLVSHGGHGFVCAGLGAGLPHVVFHYDLEKLMHGLALARAGLGGHVSLPAIQPGRFAASLKRVYADDGLVGRARAAGAGFRARPQRPLPDLLTQAVRELL